MWMLVIWPGDESAKQLLSNPIDLCNLNDDDTINQEAESKQEPILPNDDRYEVDLKKGDMIIFIDEGRMWLLARVLDMETLGEPPGSLVEIHDFNTHMINECAIALMTFQTRQNMHQFM